MPMFLRPFDQSNNVAEVKDAFLRNNAYAAMRKKMDERTIEIENAREQSLTELKKVIRAYCEPVHA